MKLYLLFFTLCNFTWTINCLKCYTCSATELDQRCVTDVENVANVITCNKKYCTSVRMEYLDPKGKVNSMIRTCEDKPVHLNEIVEDGFYKYYYRACQEDLCNNGEGKDTSGSLLGNNGNGFGVLLVKGRAAAGNISPNLFTLTIPIFCILYKLIFK